MVTHITIQTQPLAAPSRTPSQSDAHRCHTAAVRVACVGGGPGGLFAAVLLKQLPGVDGVTVYERSPEGVTHGWGVVFWDDLLDQLEIHDPPTAAAVRAQAFTWTDQVIEVAGDQVNVGGHG